MDVGDDFFRWLNHATTQAGERQRRAHQFQKGPPFERVIPFFGLLGKFAAHKFFEDRRIGELFEVAPILSRRIVFLPAKNAVAQQFEIDVTIVTHQFLSEPSAVADG